MTISKKVLSKGKKHKFTFQFTIKDEKNKKVKGANVKLEYRQGNNTTPVSKVSPTSGKAKISFTVKTKKGSVTISSSGIDAPVGYAYDKDLNDKYSDDCPAFSENCASYVFD